MLKAPYIRAAVVGRVSAAPPLEYYNGSRHGAASMLAALRSLDDPRELPSVAPSLALWLYRSSLLRRLWLEGVVYDAIVRDRVTAKEFTRLLHHVLQTPRFLRGENATTTDTTKHQKQQGSEAALLVWGIQKEFALRVLGSVVEENRWLWTLQETWDCATTLVRDFIHPDDLVSVSLLLPLVQRLAAREDKELTFHEGLRKLHERKLHGGVLWLLARRTTPTPRLEQEQQQELLEAATTSACSVPTSLLIKTSESGLTGEGDDDVPTMTSLLKPLVMMHTTTITTTAATAQRRSVFFPFWRILLREMVRCAHSVLQDPTAKDRQQVGAFLSLRRILCSFRRHNRVRPVLELHGAIILPWQSDSKTDPSAVNAPYGPLLFREALLLDAYTLMTLGHLGETAVDVDDEDAREVMIIQSRCVSHLDALAKSEPNAGIDCDAIGLHRGARATLQRRLHEGIRLSFKVLLRRGAYESICELLTHCPALGGSWEGGKALVMLGKHMEAVSVFTQFLESTRQRFVSGLPHHIRCEMLTAVESAARNSLDDLNDVSGLLLRLYELTRTWNFPVPAAVTFASIVRAFDVKGNGTEEFLVGQHKERLELLNTLLHHHVTVAEYVKDGLLLETVEIYVKLLYFSRDDNPPSQHLRLLVSLQCAHPELPIYRVSILHFVRLEYTDAVDFLLRHIVLKSSDATAHLVQLQELPLTTLETLSHHVTERRKYEDERVVSAVLQGLEFRRSAEEQRSPWQCHLCREWNKKNASVCRLCNSLELAVICCRTCGGFSSTNSPNCLVCGNETKYHHHHHGDKEDDPHAMDDSVIYPLRRWRCAQCNHTNEPQHLFYCSKCGSPQPSMEEALTHTAFDCHVCSRHNPLGLLRPWCSACGTLSRVAASGPPKTLWRCMECHTLTPWLLTYCHGCGGSKPSSVARFETSWFTRNCMHCKLTNSAWSLFCHGCGLKLTPYEVDTKKKKMKKNKIKKREKKGEKREEEILRMSSARGGVTKELPPTSCRYCGSLYASEGEMKCHTCFAFRPNKTFIFWICLQNNCLGANLHMRKDDGLLLVCHHCGTEHSHDTVEGYKSNPLRYKEPTLVEKEEGHARSENASGSGQGNTNSSIIQMPTAVLLSAPSGPRTCSSCGTFLQLENIAQICETCHHCGYASVPPPNVSAVEHDIALRLILRAMLQMVHRVKHDQISRSAALSLLRSTTAALLCAEEDALPWRGCDLSNNMRCGVKSAVPVMEDDTVHSSIRDVSEIIQTICEIASSKRMEEIGTTREDTVLSWMDKRPWIHLGLDLVDLMNRTTEYDELGFDVLAQLCMVVRPNQYTHIHRETRWTYLRYMKLPREWFTNDVVCPNCLLPTSRNSDKTEHTCSCLVGTTDSDKTIASTLITKA